MNERELLAAHGELSRDVRSWAQRQYRVLDEHPHGDRAPGHVPGWVIPRLEECAQSIRYPVRYKRRVIDGIRDCLGITVCQFNPGEYLPEGIDLVGGMSPASNARVLSHELSHALEMTRLADPRYRMAACLRAGSYDVDSEEVTAETTAALIARALRTGEGDEFSLWYLASNGSPRLLESTRDDAVRRASAILTAIA